MNDTTTKVPDKETEAQGGEAARSRLHNEKAGEPSVTTRRDLPNPGTEPASPVSPALAVVQTLQFENTGLRSKTESSWIGYDKRESRVHGGPFPARER
ncbi:hypothetical protein CapIbe_017539 [Capra ibex]